ncbi:MAG: hypothetical protein PHH49_06230 [Candidatus Omnitrophica bacterium]|nr:hypothetical protein [Candidatus Omnitrophota bacterium]MDD5488537.1 hypothetical protein [Candidatus Omnitrophota bacterium]
MKGIKVLFMCVVLIVNGSFPVLCQDNVDKDHDKYIYEKVGANDIIGDPGTADEQEREIEKDPMEYDEEKIGKSGIIVPFTGKNDKFPEEPPSPDKDVFTESPGKDGVIR